MSASPVGASRFATARGTFVFLALGILAVFRPGVDRLDRWLARRFWNVPSEWNAVADAAVHTGIVDPLIGGRPASWRHASIVESGGARYAVVIVSDMRRSRAAILDEHYNVLGRFERATSNPAVVTDEARGYKPLTNVWPFAKRGDRLDTLVAFAPLVSEQPNQGLFAYVAIGAADNELLFAIHMRWGPGPTWGVLDRADLNGDGFDDFVVYSKGRKDVPALATFVWDEPHHTYRANVSRSGAALLTFWTTGDDRRISISQYEPIDNTVLALMRILEGDAAAAPPTSE